MREEYLSEIKAVIDDAEAVAEATGKPVQLVLMVILLKIEMSQYAAGSSYYFEKIEELHRESEGDEDWKE